MAPRVMADWDERGVIVYQAFEDRIVQAAAAAQAFEPGSGFSLERMTWIKPSLGWMLYRSGYATKHNQTSVARVRITREGFEQILSAAVPTHWDRGIYETREAWGRALKAGEARYQWDPERDLRLNKTGERALQVGIEGSLVRRYAREWIVSIEDYTWMARDILDAIKRGAPLPEAPLEREYPLPEAIARQLGVEVARGDEDGCDA